MSYFLIATGSVPPIDDIPGLRFVPAEEAQDYVTTIVSDHVDARDRGVTYLLDDGTMTSDTVIAEASDQVAGGVALEDSRLGRVVLRLLDAGCTIRVWWPRQTGGLPDLDAFDHPIRFVERLTARLRSGEDLNSIYKPRT